MKPYKSLFSEEEDKTKEKIEKWLRLNKKGGNVPEAAVTDDGKAYNVNYLDEIIEDYQENPDEYLKDFKIPYSGSFKDCKKWVLKNEKNLKESGEYNDDETRDFISKIIDKNYTAKSFGSLVLQTISDYSDSNALYDLGVALEKNQLSKIDRRFLDKCRSELRDLIDDWEAGELPDVEEGQVDTIKDMLD
jgi:hypothetical protein